MELSKIKVTEYKPLRDLVFDTLREAIMTGKLKPNERIMEVNLAETLGVSRTPVREAIRKLELEGLVTMHPRKGAYISDISTDSIIEVLQIRKSLEALAISLAIPNITDADINKMEQINNKFGQAIAEDDFETITNSDYEMHEIIYIASRNKRLINMMQSLDETMKRFRMVFFNDIADTKELIEEHEHIIEALKVRDEKKATDSINLHMDGIINKYKKTVR